MSKTDTYKEVRIFETENSIARVYIPDITPEERDRRMKEIGRVAARLLSSMDSKKTMIGEKNDDKKILDGGDCRSALFDSNNHHVCDGGRYSTH